MVRLQNGPILHLPIWRKPTLPELSLAWCFYAPSLPGGCKSSREHGAFPDLLRLSAKGCSVNGLGMEAGQSSAACHVPSSAHGANLQHFLWTSYKGPCCMSPEGLCSISSSVFCKKMPWLGSMWTFRKFNCVKSLLNIGFGHSNHLGLPAISDI